VPSPFPGMDPFLEHPAVFPGVHDRLITYLSEALQTALPPPYFAEINERLRVETADRTIGPDVDVVRGQGPSTQRPETEPATAGDVRPVETGRVPVETLNRALRRRCGDAQEIPLIALPCGTAVELDPQLLGLLQGDLGPAWRDFLALHGV